MNHFFVILYLCSLANGMADLSIRGLVPIFLAALLLMDISYIVSANVTGNRILYLFCGLLALDGWYLLVSFRNAFLADLFFRLLSPVIIYVSVTFILVFLFQGYSYQYKKGIDILLMITCVSTIVSVFLTKRIFAACYGIQFVISILSFLFIALYHHERVGYVVRSEKKALLISVWITVMGFFIYYFATLGIRDHIGNFGVYLTVLIFSLSIHGIVLKESSGVPLSTVFDRGQRWFISAVCIAALCLISLAYQRSALLFAIEWNVFAFFIFLCNMILGWNLRKKSNMGIENHYTAALEKLRKEEQLKAEFSNFLHDDILQDLLSVKNMLSKAYRPEVQDIIYEALDGLNVRIRERMQDYHPVILKNLTVKENYQQLIKEVTASFPQRHITISFECPQDIFIPEPYDMLLYRILRELLTNVCKHSDGDCAWIILAFGKARAILTVSDNGTAEISPKAVTNALSQKGILSVREQTEALGGSMDVSRNQPCGMQIRIEIPMKGDVSYQHFVS